LKLVPEIAKGLQILSKDLSDRAQSGVSIITTTHASKSPERLSITTLILSSCF
jgi:hypothetical protein